MSKKLPKQISERLRKLMTGYELPHGTEFKDLEAFLAEELERVKTTCPICNEKTTKKGAVKHIDKMIKIALANQKKEMIERIEEGIDNWAKENGYEGTYPMGELLDDIIRAIK